MNLYHKSISPWTDSTILSQTTTQKYTSLNLMVPGMLMPGWVFPHLSSVVLQMISYHSHSSISLINSLTQVSQPHQYQYFDQKILCCVGNFVHCGMFSSISGTRHQGYSTLPHMEKPKMSLDIAQYPLGIKLSQDENH